MIEYKKGDLFKDSENWDILIHGCNCFCTMGAGIAKLIKQKYPKAYYEDLKTIKGDKNKLGSFTEAIYDDKIIINAYTQYYFANNNDVFEYDSFEKIMKLINNQYDENVIIAMPKIGTGLAGGNWDRILKIIETNSDNLNIIIYEL